MKSPLLSQGGASEFIRAAERSIAAGDLNLALQQIANARSIDPNNEYLDAIVERIDLLSARKAPVGKNGFLQSSLARSFESEQPQMTPELQARVKRLTNVAINLFERGSYETAFDSLMKAYLLDPTSTYVMNCERTLLPAIELMRKRGTITSQPKANAASLQSPGHKSASEESGSTDESRLETLKRQKDADRQEKERAMWRDASKPFDPTARKVEPPKNSPPGTTDSNSRQSGGFFNKLRGGKLLG
jgi:tetratricopeptide (TPR) repeat protein